MGARSCSWDGARVVIRLVDKGVSRVHFCIEFLDGEWLILDQKSRNGTFVSRERIFTCVLQDGDRIKAGDAKFTFSLQEREDSQQVEHVLENIPERHHHLVHVDEEAKTRKVI
jgi:pSer/pThr/pTyr-binding forkhead associated (FHA) protein